MHLVKVEKLAGPLAWSSAAKLLGMFLLILGAKFWMLRMSGAPLPFFDQWQAEGRDLLQPWLHGELHLRDLFAPWIQHRILWTRLLVLGLFQLNGQWDTQVEAVTAELIHAGTALLLGLLLIRRLGRAWEDAILVCLVLLFALPLALANTFSGGFVSQYYILLLSGVVAVWGLGSHPPGSAAWWTGAASAAAAWFSVAAGPLPALAVAAWMALRLARREGSPSENGITLGVALALGIGGLCTGFGVEPMNAMKAGSLGELFLRFFGLLGWPNPTAWAAPLACAPFAWLVVRTLNRRQPTGPTEAFLIPLGFFVLLNTAALAYARNHDHDLQTSRYMDFLGFGALVNFLCLLLFLRETGAEGTAPRTRAWAGALTACWVAGAGFGLIQLTTHNLADTLPFMKTIVRHDVENVAAFVARPDAQKQAGRGFFVTMCDDPQIASDLLQDPKIRQILPAEVRPPVSLEAVSVSPLVHPAKTGVGGDGSPGWVLEPPRDGQPVYFRSRIISGSHLPYLRFPQVSDFGGDAFIALVEERSGATAWLPPGALRNGWQLILVKTPAGPFHIEAVVAARAKRGLTFSDPREVGRLSAWADFLLDAAPTLLFAGFALWLGTVFWRRLGLPSLFATGKESAAPPGPSTPGRPGIPFKPLLRVENRLANRPAEAAAAAADAVNGADQPTRAAVVER